MLTRHEGNEPIYITQLILTPNCTLSMAEPLQIWFSNLLTSTGDKFDMLAKATYKLDNWATHTEIMRYHRIDTKRHEIKEEMAMLQARLSLDNEALDSCRFQIEVSRVPHMLCNLQGWSDFPMH